MVGHHLKHLAAFAPCNALITTHFILSNNMRYSRCIDKASCMSRKPAVCRVLKAREMSGPILDASASFDPAQRQDSKLFSAAASRNTQPIIDVLTPLLADCLPGPVISVAEGSGQHASSFAKAFPQFTFQPTEIDSGALESISSYRRWPSRTPPSLARSDAICPPAARWRCQTCSRPSVSMWLRRRPRRQPRWRRTPAGPRWSTP